MGDYKVDTAALDRWVERLGLVIISMEYRLAPDHPAPAHVDDCSEAWRWFLGAAEELDVDTARIAVGGASAGGGIAAGTVQRIYDEGGQQPALQLLVYPMIDDRTVNRVDPSAKYRVWTTGSNRYGWTSYLGCQPGSENVPQYAVPSRRDDLAGLPPAWIGVGTLDLFLEEDKEYARRLKEAGVEATLDVVDGAFHGFDAILSKSTPAKEFMAGQDRAIKAALRID